MTTVPGDHAEANRAPDARADAQLHLRRSILELAPLELDCMNALWSAGEGTVRDIQQAMVATRPRAYTTIMTILDRLAQKGVVSRAKTGRAYVYRPQLTAEQARAHAVARIVDGFFDGSAQALVAQLAGAPSAASKSALGATAGAAPLTRARDAIAGTLKSETALPAALVSPAPTPPETASLPALDAALL